MTDIERMIIDIDNLVLERMTYYYSLLDTLEYGTKRYQCHAGELDSVYHFAYDIAEFDCTIQDALDALWENYFDACDRAADGIYYQGYSFGALTLIEKLKRIERDYYFITDSPIYHVLSVCKIDDFNIM